MALLFVLSAPFHEARADAANPYGDKGRTIVSGGPYGFTTNLEQPDPFGHTLSWATGIHLTLVHFVVDNFAVGGTILGHRTHQDDGPHTSTSRTWYGVDLDVVGHVPMSRRLSLRFWVWGGFRSNRTYSVDDWQPSGASDWHRYSLMGGLTPELLLHLSQSMALAFGPSCSLDIPLQGGNAPDFEWDLGPTMTYSFGPDSMHGETLESARHFSARGRTSLVMYGTLGDLSITGYAGFVRFLVDGFGLGAYASGGTSAQAEHPFLNTLGAGAQAMADFAFPGSFSILAAPRAGYMWKRLVTVRSPVAAVHEVQLALPVFLAMHLHERLVIGVGPEVLADLSLFNTSDVPHSHYVRGGVGSLIAGSF